jgi:DHA2 family methylenomycin A resistance protein-like MFS transporter
MKTLTRSKSAKDERQTKRARQAQKAEIAWIVAATSFAFVVVQLDVTIVNVALPRIQADLNSTTAELQWVVDAYTLGFAAFLLSAGSIGDRFGSRRTFVIGLLGFAATSLACGLAPNATFLNCVRALQGIGAALLVPSSLALLNAACAHDKKLLASAIGLWTAAGGVSIAAGPVVGGFLVGTVGWRSVFLVNLPICALGLLMAARHIPRSSPELNPGKFDIAGQLLVIAGLTGLIGAVIEVRPLGISHPVILGGVVLGLLAGIGFALVESKIHNPMLPLILFRNSIFTGSIFFGILANLTYYGIIFVLSLYLQKSLGYTTLQAGMAFLPLTATFIASNIASGWLAGRAGTRLPMIMGSCIAAVGYWLLRRLGAESHFIDMMLAFVLIPAGMGLAVPAMTTAILSSVDRGMSGTASAVLNAARQTGGAIGVAAFGALTVNGAPDPIVSGLDSAAIISTLLLGIAAFVAYKLR